MNINPTKNINFKSEIHIVSPNDYERVINTMSEKGNDYKNIYDYNIINPWANKYERYKAYKTDCKLVSTEDIRSCTGLLAIDKGKSTRLAMHLYDSKKNIDNLAEVTPYINGTNAIVIGSKKKFEHSSTLFDKIAYETKKKKIPVSIFKNLSLHWQASIAYDAEKDIIFLCVNEIMRPQKFVKNMRELKKVFSKIKIAPTDKIKFLCK